MVLVLFIIKLLYLINFCSYPSAPKLSIQMSDSNSGAALTAGQNYGIICSVLGAENLDSTISYRWMKMSQIISNSNTHSLTLVRISDAGINYSCSATIASSYLTGRIAAVMYRRVRIQSELQSHASLLILLYWHTIVSCSSNSVIYYSKK